MSRVRRIGLIGAALLLAGMQAGFAQNMPLPLPNNAAMPSHQSTIPHGGPAPVPSPIAQPFPGMANTPIIPPPTAQTNPQGITPLTPQEAQRAAMLQVSPNAPAASAVPPGSMIPLPQGAVPQGAMPGSPATIPVPASSQPMQVAKPAVPNAAKPGDKKADDDDGDESDLSKPFTSFMFPPALITGFDKAIAAAMESMSKDPTASATASKPEQNLEDDIMKQLAKSQPKEDNVVVKKSFPIFFLNSIIYTSRNQWSAWINGVRFTNQNNKPDSPFFISSVSSTQVTVRWKPKGIWPDLMKVWKTMTKQPATITVDEINGYVSFMLHPNQTFLSQVLQIHEGHYMQDEDNSSTAADAQPQPQQPPASSPMNGAR